MIKENRNKVFNIYDLAGNLNELTMEIELGQYVIVRGGSFDQKGTSNIGNYTRIGLSESSSNVGIRPVMYID